MAEHVANSTIRKGEVTDEAAPTRVERRSETTTINEGQKVNKSDFTQEEWDELVATGVVTDDPTELVRAPSLKTADVQTDAADASSTDEHEGTDPDEANELANKTAKSETDIRREVEQDQDLTDKVLSEHADSPHEHRHALHVAREAEVQKRLADETGGGSKKTTAKGSGSGSNS